MKPARLRELSHPSRSVPTPRTRFLLVGSIVTTLAHVALFGLVAEAQLNVKGRWTPTGSAWGHMQIHLAVLPGDGTHHSKILSWSYSHLGSFWDWDSTSTDCQSFPTSQFTPDTLDALPDDLFCSGHSSLANGDLLIAGGHDHANDVGLRKSYLFRRNAPAGQQWIERDVLESGRWYPTNVTLSNGDALTFSGTRFYHMVMFGGTSAPQTSNGSAGKDIHRLGLTTAGHWQPVLTEPPNTVWPAPREGHSATWDRSRQEMLVFGGRDSGATTVRQDTWRLAVGEQPFAPYSYAWTPVTATPPDPRTRHIAISRNRPGVPVEMIVFGGRDTAGAPLSDVWKLSRVLSTYTWTPLSPSGTGSDLPGARYGHAAVYDSVGDRMLVFGGRTTDSTLADDQLYELKFTTTPQWKRISLSTRPPARDGHTMAIDRYGRIASPFSSPDAVRDQRFVLFGGKDATDLRRDLWALWVDGANNDNLKWESKGTPSGPAARTRHAAQWDGTPLSGGDVAYDRMVLVGGQTSGGGATSEVWALDTTLTTWTPLPDAAVALAGQSVIHHTRKTVGDPARAIYHCERPMGYLGHPSTPPLLPIHVRASQRQPV